MDSFTTPEGTHGTTVSRADAIRKSGFERSKGRFGKGVYFWSHSPYAEYLARAWWRFEYERNHYSSDKHQGCAILWAEFKIEENDLIDLDNKEIKTHLAMLCKNKGIGYNAKGEEVAAIIMLFVSQIENQLGHRFKIMETTTTPAPKKFVEKYPISALGAPSCYVVLDTGCIVIKDVTFC
jgi:hypothetical protein